ncbi:MAG: hypothetical protein LC799_19675 [Actinobacteria bacterium]|nr:hypothetical protein [Actinomycetota bacterium]
MTVTEMVGVSDGVLQLDGRIPQEDRPSAVVLRVKSGGTAGKKLLMKTTTGLADRGGVSNSDRVALGGPKAGDLIECEYRPATVRDFIRERPKARHLAALAVLTFIASLATGWLAMDSAVNRQQPAPFAVIALAFLAGWIGSTMKLKIDWDKVKSDSS